MPDLYSFTFDEQQILPILARGGANTVDTFNYAGDGRIYSKSNKAATDPIDIVTDFPWTKSPKSSRSDVPVVYIKEKRLLTNSTLANFFYSVLAGAEVLETGAERLKSGIIQAGANSLNVYDELESAAGDAYPGIEKGLDVTKETAAAGSKFIGEQKEKVSQFLNENQMTDNILKPYNGLYYTEDTGFKYFLPYLSDSYLGNNNTFSVDSQKILGLSQISETMAAGFDAVRGAAFMDKPGVYVEQSKQYSFGAEGRTFDVSFPLLNTGTYDEVKRNWQLLFGLIYQNTPGRINRNLLEMPVIYEFFIEGMAYMPYSYIKSIQIDFIGNRRTMGIDIPGFNETSGNQNLQERTTINTVVPDAYNVKITFEGLNKETRNFLIRSLGNPIIKVKERGKI
jgi:hypothetical protein|tara:strand:+ start:1528 stop:2715 length:1188 start_codon:yes stop_codon:yes gene_type:complete